MQAQLLLSAWHQVVLACSLTYTHTHTEPVKETWFYSDFKYLRVYGTAQLASHTPSFADISLLDMSQGFKVVEAC